MPFCSYFLVGLVVFIIIVVKPYNFELESKLEIILMNMLVLQMRKLGVFFVETK